MEKNKAVQHLFDMEDSMSIMCYMNKQVSCDDVMSLLTHIAGEVANIEPDEAEEYAIRVKVLAEVNEWLYIAMNEGLFDTPNISLLMRRLQDDLLNDNHYVKQKEKDHTESQ